MYSTGGCTLAIQSMLTWIKCHGFNTVYAWRMSHRSFVSAAILLGLDIIWLDKQQTLPSTVREKSALFITNIDYYGNVFPIEKLLEFSRNNPDAPILADNAHGAYQVFTPEVHPLRNGAWFVADSAHKSLPVLTGGAYIHMRNAENLPEIRECAALFGSTSPSYLILESLDLCNVHIALQSRAAWSAFRAVGRFREELTKMGFALLETDSLLHVTINARVCGYTGEELADELRLNGGEPEFADENFLVLLFSTVTSREDVLAAIEIFRKIPLLPSKKPVKTIFRQLETSPRSAYFSEPSEHSNFCNETSADTKTAAVTESLRSVKCPPCVPV
ncbi:hypothetical protein FACS189499_01130 [Clostridia bacterium]|nr:hypothetical protein FACS189499_01130 [Clostridia bacterium]